ncbi:MAG: MarR family transcriptional regulator [Halanaerobium sp.]|nr:MarR family transcriptional regulator [Halanaerobium sp.]
MEDNTNSSIGIARLLKQVLDAIKQNIEREFREMNLTGSQGMLVGILAHNGEMKISDLSARMGLSNSTVSGIIDRLEKQGCVERIRSKEDRRVVFVRVTADFNKKAKSNFNRIEHKIESIMKEATEEEIDRILDGLKILQKLLDRKLEGE